MLRKSQLSKDLAVRVPFLTAMQETNYPFLFHNALTICHSKHTEYFKRWNAHNTSIFQMVYVHEFRLKNTIKMTVFEDAYLRFLDINEFP